MHRAILALLALITITGCEPEHVPAPRRRVLVNYSITVASKDNCAPCVRQMKLLDEMKKDGDLKGVIVRKADHSRSQAAQEDYPATLFPTLYIKGDSGMHRIEGYQDRSSILRLLR